MSPLRPTSTSPSRSADGGAISPIGVMLCALATLLAVPVLLSSGASSDGEEVAAVPVVETVSESDLDADVEMDELFDAGARIDDVPVAPSEAAAVTPADASPIREGATLASDAAAASTTADEAVVERPDAAESSDGEEATPATTTPTTAAPTTAAPTTAAPTTAAPTTAAPTTAAPTTTAPPATEAPAEEPAATEEADGPVVESPQEQAPPVQTEPTPEQWAALRHCESSGNYSIVSRNGLYHGAYQFYQPTWDGLARQVGRDDLVGLPPSQASPADQDALALLLWQQRGPQPWPVCGRHLPPKP